ncbi:hypothetical protein V4F39_06075 [Aquincola sp. MAHUQ-54]|uniref:Uncharacterized protein n=1 Tax=Aquincola agrisoli TaxID=3119538 RepID=A0AAW9QDH8_9BURK
MNLPLRPLLHAAVLPCLLACALWGAGGVAATAHAAPWAVPAPAAAASGLRIQLAKPVVRRPLLGPGAFAAPRNCALDPFADANGEQRERQFDHADRDCPGERFALNMAAPRPSRPAAAQARRFDLSVDQWMSARMDRLMTSARLGWMATGDARLGWQTARALVAAGSLLRLNDDWAMELQFGRDRSAAALRSRAKWSTLWRVAGEHLLYVQVAAEEAGAAQVIGLRWWLAPRRATLDLSAHRSFDGERIEPRFNLSVRLGR